MTGWLDGKRALVVGAGSGIGRAVVDAFIAEGAKVAVLERDSDKCDQLRQQLPEVPVVEGDATTRAANDHAVTRRLRPSAGSTHWSIASVSSISTRASPTSTPTTLRQPSTKCSAPTC